MNVIQHYDKLINDNDDPFHDLTALRKHMKKRDVKILVQNGVENREKGSIVERRYILMKKWTALILAAIFLLFIACDAKQSVSTTDLDQSTPDTHLSSNPTSPPTGELAPLPTEKPISVTGAYLLDLGEHGADEPAAVRLELLEKDNKLGILFTVVYDTYEVEMQYAIKPRINSGIATVKYENEYLDFELSCDGRTADVVFHKNGVVDGNPTGQYARVEIPREVEFPVPVFPEPENDPNTPCGAIDKTLAAAARAELGLPSDSVLTEEDCAKVLNLNVLEEKLVSLNGIEYFSSLRSLTVMTSYLHDISPLAGLTSVESISINCSYIKTIPDFSGCDNLTYLSLVNNCISDLSPIASIPSLERLELNSNLITSIAPIRDLHSLKSLYITDNMIIDWDCIEDNSDLIAALEFIDYDLILTVIKRAREIVNETVADEMSDFEKEIAIYLKIQEISSPGEGSCSLLPDDYNLTRPDAYSVIMEGHGFCGDYMQAVSLMMNMAGLHCISVTSDVHAWNMIELDGEWYELDCVLDDNQFPLYWGLFNISRARMDGAWKPWHDLDLLRYPLAKQSMSKLEYLMHMDSQVIDPIKNKNESVQ